MVLHTSDKSSGGKDKSKSISASAVLIFKRCRAQGKHATAKLPAFFLVNCIQRVKMIFHNFVRRNKLVTLSRPFIWIKY